MGTFRNKNILVENKFRFPFFNFFVNKNAHLTNPTNSSNNARGRWALNNEENFTIATAEISNRSVEDEIEQNDEKSEKMAFEVQLTPQSQKKKSAKSPGEFI